MARRDSQSNAPLTEVELEEYRKKVEAFSRQELEVHYRALHNVCRYDGMRVPSPQLVQQFVQVWKRLRALKGNAKIWP